MSASKEKVVLLRAIENIKRDIKYSKDLNIDLLQRYDNLVQCLLILEWKEVGSRDHDV